MTPDPDRSIIITRRLRAPRDLVFRLFTEAEHLDAWWGPNGFRNETHALDFAVGGLWHYTMHGPDGKDWPNWIRYTAIEPPARLTYDHGGELGEPAHFQGTITLSEEGAETTVTLSLTFPTRAARDATLEFGAVAGGEQTLARLDAYALEQLAWAARGSGPLRRRQSDHRRQTLHLPTQERPDIVPADKRERRSWRRRQDGGNGWGSAFCRSPASSIRWISRCCSWRCRRSPRS